MRRQPRGAIAAVAGVVIGAVLIALAGCGHSSSGDRDHSRTATASSSTSSAPRPGRPGFVVAPLIAPSALLTTADPTRWRDLSFAPPTTEAAYLALTPAQQRELRAALAAVDCARPPRAVDYRVVCNADSSPKRAYLAGAVLVDYRQVVDARTYVEGTAWSVAVHLNSTGTAAVSRYTTDHHTDQSGVPDNQCGPTAPCADYLALIVGTQAVSVPVVLAPITAGQISLGGQLTEQSATELLAKIVV